MAHNFKLYPELTNPQLEMYYFDSPHRQITEDFNARVVKVTDGDTIRVKTSFRDFDFPIRFSNIMAAELNEENGTESRNWLNSQIMGETVEIKVDRKNRVEKWGRLLGRVEHRGFDMGEESIANGMSLGIEEEKEPQDAIKLLITEIL